MTASALLCGYLIGSVPFAYLVARRLGGVDLRTAGSRNVGAANVFRTTRPKLAAAAVALDLAKGAAAVAVARALGAGSDWTTTAAGVAAIVGHVYPVWLGFHGGKGVATACGVFSMLAPMATMLAVGIFVVTVWITRYVSLGSVSAMVALGPLVYYTGPSAPILLGALLAAGLIVFRHRSNLGRILAGTERRLGQRA